MVRVVRGHARAKNHQTPFPEEVPYLFRVVDKGEHRSFSKRSETGSMLLFKQSVTQSGTDAPDSVAGMTETNGTARKVSKGRKGRTGDGREREEETEWGGTRRGWAEKQKDPWFCGMDTPTQYPSVYIPYIYTSVI